MRIVIIGAGEVGTSLAASLVEDGHDIVVVEQDEEKIARIENELDVMAVLGNGARPQVLEKAGVGRDRIDFLIACTDRDEVNILACWIARRAGVGSVISRARSMEFTDTKAWARDLGIQAMISPERSVARQIEELLSVSSALEAAELAGGRAGIYAFSIADHSSLAGMRLRDLTATHPRMKAMIVYVKRGGEGLIPAGNDRLLAGDICYVVALREQVWQLEELFQLRKSRSLHRVLLAGGGKSGFQVARLLESRGVDVRLIELDGEKCERLSQELERTLVLHGDAADQALLRSEGIDLADGFVATTASDEVNILLAVLAKAMGAKKSVALVRRKTFRSLDRYVSVDAMIDPTEALTSVILRYVRYPGVEGALSLFDKIGAETLEVELAEDSPARGRRVMDLGWEPGTLMALVIRGHDVFVPRGDTVLQGADRVLLFSTPERLRRAVDGLGVH
ncbi:Trk system potassium transporter TrkA [Aminithiophilus ramosus]|uniref:Trk system potassium uptake protein TrkA n=2 Tax=Synergistales TaxID=649776 RepID=A0A9Q7AQ48_9BACT|nr:Trk system potassium transporter TrkA [Aminithiophilus ramosus]QTX32807.1 Trk system potassium transporter TrkA [Aminithiophilus ramosus]QVL36682.1 Trk system potassium transporter TrkA [Synergistota bacterium]